MGVRPGHRVPPPISAGTVNAVFPNSRSGSRIYAQVDTPRRARFWEDLGADAIVLEKLLDQPELSPTGGYPPDGPLRSGTDREPRRLMNCPMQTYQSERFRHASDDSSTLFIDYCLYALFADA